LKNTFRESLLSNTLTLGGWMQIGHPACGEVLAAVGFDWICVDLEHGAIDLESMANIFRAVSAFDCVPVARLPANDPIWIRRSLDAGAKGLIIPMIKTAREAQAAVNEAKYPPKGTRGFGYSRANMHGMRFAEYVASANDDIAMIMQIEHIDAIQELDAILAIDGVDALFIGPLDLSGSMGIVGQMEHPKMVAALEKYLVACRTHGKSAGLHIVRPHAENIKQALGQGYRLIALGLDNVFIEESAKACLALAKQ